MLAIVAAILQYTTVVAKRQNTPPIEGIFFSQVKLAPEVLGVVDLGPELLHLIKDERWGSTKVGADDG